MTNRFKEAVLIIQGACNPSGIAHALVAAAKEIMDAGGDTRDVASDPAMRLIGYQMSHVLQTSKLDDLAEFREVSQKCKEEAKRNYLSLVPKGIDGASNQELADFVRRIAMRDQSVESVDDIVTEARALILGVDNEIQETAAHVPRM